MPNMQGREGSVQTSLQAIAKKAESQPGYRFRNLFRMLNEGMLKDSWRYIRKDAAYGVDRVSAAEYEQNLDENIHQMVENLKQKRFRAKLVRRRYIPKGNGKLRPLGIPATQDKLLQIGVKRILEAIYVLNAIFRLSNISGFPDPGGYDCKLVILQPYPGMPG